MASNEIILQSLKNALQEIAHNIRTPLSTVMNDLSYFSNQLGDAETERPLGACRKISAFLETFASAFSVLHLEKISVSKLFSQIVTNKCVLADKNALWGALKFFSEDVKSTIQEDELIVEINEMKTKDGIELSAAFLTLVSHGQLSIKNRSLTLRMFLCD